jgi:uncharacterized membrane protein
VTEYVICKACGYVMKKDRLKDKCPACGVPAKMFEPHDDRLSPSRRFILGLDLHPILIHFPQAFVVTILFLLPLTLFIRGEIQTYLTATITVLTFCLPFVTAIAFLAGLFDGRIRFRRLTTEILTKKMILGLILIVLSLAAFILTQFYSLDSPALVYLLIAVFCGCLVCSILLALLGVGLLNAKFPG